MPKISRFGGHTNAGLTDTDAGFSDDTVRTQARADALAGGPTAANDIPTVGPGAGPGELGDDDGADAIERARLAEAGRDNTEDLVDPPFNPSELTVADVNDLLADPDLTDDQREAVLAAERAGKNRTGILGKAEDRPADGETVSIERDELDDADVRTSSTGTEGD